MIRIDTQIHGYRQGHQLLSASANLSKEDQSLIDQLSDMAGPLRPGEMFDPYLSGYPLPSGNFYVLARTWQDLVVSRAGCVRTLSLLIPTLVWSSAPGLQIFLDLLQPHSLSDTAEHVLTETPTISPLPLTRGFQARELLEALFLEEGRPVAIFDVPEPELAAVRLLTSLWPSIRAGFCVSTFALSPRKIKGRDFDLVFAPRDARPKFSDWPGRRIDGRADKGPRHRWTNRIVDRVFGDSYPRLLNDSNQNLIGCDAVGDPAVLRIALMWDDLLDKLEQTPSAVLGLLDIVSSGVLDNAKVIPTLEPLLAKAADHAAACLPESEAWDFIGAMVRKLHRMPITTGVRSVAAASRVLARRDPAGAIVLVDHSGPDGEVEAILACLAIGIAEEVNNSTERALVNARPETFARLVCAERVFAERVVNTPALIERLAEVLKELSTTLFGDVKRIVLPLLTEDTQIAGVLPLVASLDAEALLAKMQQLGKTNSFEATTFIAPMVARAREIGAITRLRDGLLLFPVTENRDLFLSSTLTRSVEDVVWLLEEHLDLKTTGRFLVDILRGSDASQFNNLLSDDSISVRVLQAIPLEGSDVLRRVLVEVNVPFSAHMSTTLRLLPVSDRRDGVVLATRALERCLAHQFGGDEVDTISMLLGVVGEVLDGSWVIQHGLKRKGAAHIVSRNLVAFERAPEVARVRILNCIENLSRALECRYTVDLDDAGAQAFARLILDANDVDSKAVLRASERVLPMLFRSGRKPVSVVIAATFPVIYRELRKQDSSPILLHFMLFVDWDRCKTARRNLVGAFLSSQVWAPGDLALTAYRCMDVERILKRAAKTVGGEAYIRRLEADLQRLPVDCRELTMETITRIRLELSDKHTSGE